MTKLNPETYFKGINYQQIELKMVMLPIRSSVIPIYFYSCSCEPINCL